jgi:hypothetical protein
MLAFGGLDRNMLGYAEITGRFGVEQVIPGRVATPRVGLRLLLLADFCFCGNDGCAGADKLKFVGPPGLEPGTVRL